MDERTPLSLQVITREMVLLTGAAHGRCVRVYSVENDEWYTRFWADGHSVGLNPYNQKDLYLSLNKFSMRFCQLPAIYWLRRKGFDAPPFSGDMVHSNMQYAETTREDPLHKP